jgi:putative hydrolase of the HAD superfamily
LDPFATVVFDLDDTLYPESDYVRSGFDHLGDLVGRLYGKPYRALLSAAQEAGASDPLGHALQAAGLPSWMKEHLILAYRYHRPTLTLYPGALELIGACRSRACPVFLVTDGRGITQRLKIEALGLQGLFDHIFISEELGCGKPNPLAFESIMARSQGPWVYVADNPSKDFVAPRELGWTTIGVRHTHSRIHQKDSGVQPTIWVEELSALLTPQDCP